MSSALQLASYNDYKQQNAEEHTVPLLSSVALGEPFERLTDLAFRLMR